MYRVSQPGMASVTLMPEWYLLVVALGGLALLGMLWHPLFIAAPLCALTAGASVAQAVISGARASFTEPRSRLQTLGLHALTALLHLLQPLARLRGTAAQRAHAVAAARPRRLRVAALAHLADVDRALGGARRSAWSGWRHGSPPRAAWSAAAATTTTGTSRSGPAA